MSWEAFGGRKRYDQEGWKKGPRRKAVQRDKLRGLEGEEHKPKQYKKQDQEG